MGGEITSKSGETHTFGAQFPKMTIGAIELTQPNRLLRTIIMSTRGGGGASPFKEKAEMFRLPNNCDGNLFSLKLSGIELALWRVTLKPENMRLSSLFQATIRDYEFCRLGSSHLIRAFIPRKRCSLNNESSFEVSIRHAVKQSKQSGGRGQPDIRRISSSSSSSSSSSL